MGIFVTAFSDLEPLIFVAKLLILDVARGPGDTAGVFENSSEKIFCTKIVHNYITLQQRRTKLIEMYPGLSQTSKMKRFDVRCLVSS